MSLQFVNFFAAMLGIAVLTICVAALLYHRRRR